VYFSSWEVSRDFSANRIFNNVPGAKMGKRRPVELSALRKDLRRLEPALISL
jgi:hypothetical protein